MKRFFHKTPTWIEKIYPNFIWKVPTKKKELFLTFDDGPIPEVTPYILDMLASFNAKATFFCVGQNLVKNTDLVIRMTEQGHIIGNHTFNHLKGWQTNNFLYLKNILKTEEIIKKFQDSKFLFRPPYGRIKRAQAANLEKFKIIMWNRLAYDFAPNLDVKSAIRQLTDDAPNGSIFVFHDNLKSSKNISQMLPKILEHYSSRGYKFHTLNSSYFCRNNLDLN